MKFEKVEYANISTARLTDRDLMLLPTVPGYMATTKGGSHFVYFLGADVKEEAAAFIERLHALGMSEEFILIASELCRQRIAYARFNIDLERGS